MASVAGTFLNHATMTSSARSLARAVADWRDFRRRLHRGRELRRLGSVTLRAPWPIFLSPLRRHRRRGPGVRAFRCSSGFGFFDFLCSAGASDRLLDPSQHSSAPGSRVFAAGSVSHHPASCHHPVIFRIKALKIPAIFDFPRMRITRRSWIPDKGFWQIRRRSRLRTARASVSPRFAGDAPFSSRMAMFSGPVSAWRSAPFDGGFVA